MEHWRHGNGTGTDAGLNASSSADVSAGGADSPGPASGKNFTLAHAVSMARCSSWLASLNDASAELLLKQARVQLFQRGQVPIAMHDRDHALYLLLRGVIEMSMPQRADTIVPVRFLLQGEWFGEYGALTGAASHAEYRARSAVCTLAIPRASIMALSGDGAFQTAATGLMAQGLLKVTQQLADMMEKKPEDRIKAALLSLSGADDAPDRVSGIPISQDDLACITGTSRLTVNKVLRALIMAGALAARYRRIEVLRPEALLRR